jgi:ABC-type lipoprotein release transport system permease subunit
VPSTFPLVAVVGAVGVTLLLAVVVVVPPLRRATKLRPGTALRCE